MASKVFEYFKDEYLGAKDVVRFLDRNKDVVEINVGGVEGVEKNYLM